MRRWILLTGMAAIALAMSVIIGSAWQREGIAVSSAPVGIAQDVLPETTADETTSEMPIVGTYEDPQGRFQIGILESYSTNSVSGSPLFQAEDGSVAYSVVTVPVSNEAPLSDIALVEIAQQTFESGEGFQAQAFSTVPGGGLQIAWTGRLSAGAGPPQAVSGEILAKQQASEVYLLVIAAMEDGGANVSQTVSTLVSTLKIL